MKHFSGSAFVLVLLLGGLGLVLPGPAQAFRAQMQLTVIQVPGSSAFEVVEEYGAGPRQIWCAAAEHARYVARLPTAQRLYIARGLEVSDLAGGRKTVRFSPAPSRPKGRVRTGPIPSRCAMSGPRCRSVMRSAIAMTGSRIFSTASDGLRALCNSGMAKRQRPILRQEFPSTQDLAEVL